MNQDQINSLVRTAFKLIGGALIAHGLTTAAGIINSQDVIGLVVALIGVIGSHYAHSTPPGNPPRVSPKSGGGALMLALFLAAGFSFTGCQSTPQQVTYQAAGTTVVTVDTAMNLWGAYVAANHPGTNAEAAVEGAYNKYQTAMAVACDAGAIYSATASTNAPAAASALNQAIGDAAQDLTDLEKLIASYGVKLQ